MIKEIFYRIRNYFLAGYKDYSLEIQKKAEIQLVIAFLLGFFSLSTTIYFILQQFTFIRILPYLIMILGVFLTCVFIKHIKYNIVSFILVGVMVMFVSILPVVDPYYVVFELYRISLPFLLAFIVVFVISTSTRLILVTMFYSLIYITIFTYIRFWGKTDDPNLTITFLVCFIGLTSAGITGVAIFKLYKWLIQKAEEEAYAAIQGRFESEQRLNIIKVYTKPSIVDLVATGNDPRQFISVEKQCAILFSDIRNFTTISEKLSPLDLTGFLNDYFACMNGIVKKNCGEVDKLIGDSIMAEFSDADDSVQCAIDIQKSIVESSSYDFEKNQVKTGVGINFGKVIAGNIGSDDKMDYTIIGDTVNVSARLQALTKIYGVEILISDEHKKMLKRGYNIRFLDVIKVKGKLNETSIYEVYDHHSEGYKQVAREYESRLEKAFDHYKNKRFDEAMRIYQDIADGDFVNSKLLSFYIERCIYFMNNLNRKHLEDWKGVYDFNLFI